MNSRANASQISDPDAKAQGFVNEPIKPLRYDGKGMAGGEAPALIVEMLPEKSRVLDVGCGEGSIAALMREHRGATVVGVEPHPERAQAARAKGFEVVDGEFDETLAHRLGTFDAVIFADVLEHMPDPASALLASKSFLRPTGFVVASVPNVAHWSVRLNLLRGRFDYVDMGIMDATHLRWFTRRSLVAMFASCGFEVVQLQWSIGRWLREYRQQWPWRWMSFWVRGKVIRRCILLWPEAFGCQMVVKAVCSG